MPDKDKRRARGRKIDSYKFSLEIVEITPVQIKILVGKRGLERGSSLTRGIKFFFEASLQFLIPNFSEFEKNSKLIRLIDSLKIFEGLLRQLLIGCLLRVDKNYNTSLDEIKKYGVITTSMFFAK